MRVKKIIVLSFGQFNLSVKGFVTEILPHLNSIRELKLNISNTSCKDSKISYPASLQRLTLIGFTIKHLESFLFPFLP